MKKPFNEIKTELYNPTGVFDPYDFLWEQNVATKVWQPVELIAVPVKDDLYQVTISVLFKVKTKIRAISPSHAEAKADNQLTARDLETMAYEQGLTDILGYEADSKPIME